MGRPIPAPQMVLTKVGGIWHPMEPQLGHWLRFGDEVGWHILNKTTPKNWFTECGLRRRKRVEQVIQQGEVPENGACEECLARATEQLLRRVR